MRKIISLLVILCLTFGLGGTVLAQAEPPPVFCGDLSDSDCTILTDSAEAMRGLHSASAAFSLDASVGNLPEPSPDTIGINIAGVGAFSLGDDAMVLMTNPNALLENPEDLPQVIEQTLRAISADLTVTISLPEGTRALAEQNGGQELPERVGFSMRMVEGIGYANLSKLAALDTSGTLPRGWMGTDVAELMRRVLEEALKQGTDLSTLNTTSTLDSQAMIELANSYLTVERVDDITIDGQDVAVFHTTADLQALLTSDEYRQLLQDQLEQAGTKITDRDLDQFIEIYQQLTDGLEIEMQQSIGLDDHFVHSSGFTVRWNLDLNSLFGGMSGSSRQDPLDISLDFGLTLSQFDSVPTITAPDDAQVFPVDTVLRLMGLNLR